MNFKEWLFSLPDRDDDDDDYMDHDCTCNREDPPYHIINTITGEPCGPFSTYTDASRALSINNNPGWFNGVILGNTLYLNHTKETRDAAIAAHKARMEKEETE